MSRSMFSAFAALTFLAACGPKAPEGGAAPDKAAEPAAPPKVPRVMGFEAGRAVDAMGMVSGGVRTTFAPADTIAASVATENVAAGTKIEVALMSDTTTIAKAEGVAVAPDSTGKAEIGIKVGPAKKTWKLGKYQLQVLLDGKMQMAKDLEITKTGEPMPEPAAKPAPKAKAPAKAAAKAKAAGGGGL